MIRGTTPTITLTVDGCELSDFSKIYITLQQGTTEITKVISTDDEAVADNVITLKLTQEETLMWQSQMDVLIQLRAVAVNGTAVASDISKLPAERILKEGVISA